MTAEIENLRLRTRELTEEKKEAARAYSKLKVFVRQAAFLLNAHASLIEGAIGCNKAARLIQRQHRLRRHRRPKGERDILCSA